MSAFDHGDIIYMSDLRSRIDDLKSQDVDDLMEYEQEELGNLRLFARRVISKWGAEFYNSDSTSLVADTYWEEYAYEKAQDIYGAAVVESGYFDTGSWSDDMKEEYQKVSYDGVTYWGDGN